MELNIIMEHSVTDLQLHFNALRCHALGNGCGVAQQKLMSACAQEHGRKTREVCECGRYVRVGAILAFAEGVDIAVQYHVAYLIRHMTAPVAEQNIVLIIFNVAAAARRGVRKR